MYKQLDDAYADVVSNGDVRVLVITGAGDGAFSTGANISGYVADGVLGENAGSSASRCPSRGASISPLSPLSRAFA